MLTKDEIIKTVQEWSRINYSRTPSEKIIREELKIPRWEWNAFWIKVTDLQREAGLQPQGFDKSKYAKDDLCDKFIKVIREEGTLPSRAYLDFRHKQDPEFPSSGTFYDRLGQHKNGTLATSILGYIKDKQAYEDIFTICNALLEKKDDAESENSSVVNSVGYAYLLKTKLLKSTAYKIGKTKDIESRMRQLRQQSNDNQLLHKIKTDDVDGLEGYWHLRFSAKRLYPHKPKDEWFKLSPSDIAAFRRWKRIF